MNVGEIVGGLSQREANRAKRKARQMTLKQRSRDQQASSSSQQNSDNESETSEPSKKKAKKDSSYAPPPDTPVPDNTGAWPIEVYI